MAGFADILNVFREEMASSRQMQAQQESNAMQMMQWDAQRKFQAEGRQREDVIFALGEVEKTQKEAIGINTNAAISVFSKIVDPAKSLEKNYKTLRDYGFDEAAATQIYNIVSTYYGDDDVKGAPELAVDMVRNLANEIVLNKIQYDGLGEDAELKDGMLSGLLNVGGDAMLVPFQNIRNSLNILDEVARERTEIGGGDYTINIGGLLGQTEVEDAGINYGELIDSFNTGDGIGGKDSVLGGRLSDEEIIDSVKGFLPKDALEGVETDLEGLNKEIANKEATMDSLITKRDEVLLSFDKLEEKRDNKLKEMRYYYSKIPWYNLFTDDRTKKAAKEYGELDFKWRTGRLSDEAAAKRSAELNPNSILLNSNERVSNTITYEIVHLAAEIGKLHRQRKNLAD